MKRKIFSKGGRKSIFNFQFSIFNSLKIFVGLKDSFSRLSRRERVVFFILVSVLLALLVSESLKIYYEKTELVPGPGGEYVEMMVGEAKYFNPILAKSDPERSISHLIYSSLIKIDQDNNPIPDLATSWEISPDGLQYIFHLRPNVSYQKGQTFDSADVAATIASIQNDTIKSPSHDAWSGITVDTPDAFTVVLHLPKSYGPFIYNCIFEIVDSDDTTQSLSESYNGTGPYQYVQSLPNADGNLEVSLKANNSYYNGTPLISKLKFVIVNSNDRVKIDQGMNNIKNLTAISGSESSQNQLNDLSFVTGRNLVLFFNMRQEVLKDAIMRKKIIEKTANDVPVNLKLVTLNAEPLESRANEFAESLSDKNYIVDIHYQSPTDYAQSLATHDYDLLLYGYDWSYDRDPYTFWHSSQAEKQNYDGFSDKNNDIAIEDARMITDSNDRNKRYDQIYQKIKDQSLAIYFDQEKFSYFVSSSVKNIQQQNHGRPEDRFNDIIKWYMKERRVRK